MGFKRNVYLIYVIYIFIYFRMGMSIYFIIGRMGYMYMIVVKILLYMRLFIVYFSESFYIICLVDFLIYGI